jgi:hypothetical protein
MGSLRALLIGAAVVCALPASAAAGVWTLAGPAALPSVTWNAPTPAEGARIQARVGRRVSFGLSASGPGQPVGTVSIRAASLPAGAAFQPRDGNPATGAFSWTPPAGAARRTYSLTFTAQSGVPGIAPATRRVSIAVAARPRPRRRPKPERFVLSGPNELYRYAFVLRAGVARSAPRRTSAVVASLSRWTPEGTTNLVLTLDGRRTRRGVWIRVRLATLPNGRTGWVQRRMLSDWKEVRTRLVVDRRRLTATLYRRGRVIFRAPVGVGLSQWPTPRGEFYIRNQLYGFGNAVYGPIAFGTSARSAVLTDWPGGGFIGLHGTNQPSILPGRVSHGCIRMKNGHILRLARLMPVGTPLTVR